MLQETPFARQAQRTPWDLTLDCRPSEAASLAPWQAAGVAQQQQQQEGLAPPGSGGHPLVAQNLLEKNQQEAGTSCLSEYKLLVGT